ncbi:PREDICTED: 5-demethoxyubiquinone hydroxylase, mitochondrial-like [Amphimedon queenslandica]|uniref:5-demethoxyubiquinone hydroxylase, mitochondrial n=1 Tax=Amphimedon queenslandica TaxID=400682 RepID=A0A1X7VVM1_AMPQE|nr:PREDICTED: 5-demethoxyubiquinone hydroxylase, mitochondrial-like [Amphimedon queenslandica]|eukprot:XP_003382792.1 PREDICTED: 5-demethoxyubiquinone hydroxylase, mitochondrial-like [Amphimedon queenslandica]
MMKVRRLAVSLLRCRYYSTPRPHPAIDRIIRVDHAGEYGADRIYTGQMAVLGTHPSAGPVVKHMWEQEKAHLELFERLVKERRVRPTALMPLWNIAGYALGAGSALLGKEAAMACTVAVEQAIGEHYNDQLRELLNREEKDEELLKSIKDCRDDELDHLETGLEHDAEQAPAYEIFSQIIRTGCKTAIWLSERI